MPLDVPNDEPRPLNLDRRSPRKRLMNMPDTALLWRPGVRAPPRHLPPITQTAQPPIRLDTRRLPHTRVPFRRTIVPLLREIAHNAAPADSTMLMRSVDLAPVWIPRQPLRRTRPCHRHQHDSATVGRDVVLKLSMLVPGTQWPAVVARPTTTASASTTSTRVGGRLRRAAHCLSPQARQSAQPVATAPAANAGRRLFPLLRNCHPTPLQSRRLPLNPRPPLRRPQTPENAGSIPAASTSSSDHVLASSFSAYSAASSGLIARPS